MPSYCIIQLACIKLAPHRLKWQRIMDLRYGTLNIANGATLEVARSSLCGIGSVHRLSTKRFLLYLHFQRRSDSLLVMIWTLIHFLALDQFSHDHGYNSRPNGHIFMRTFGFILGEIKIQAGSGIWIWITSKCSSNTKA